MTKRTSISIQGYRHGDQPIPAASRVGPLVMTGGVHGIDPATGALAEGVEAQAKFMFLNLRNIMIAAGTDIDHVVRIVVYVKVPEARAAVNVEWLAAFPDEATRPARHTLVNENLPAGMLLQCEATAYAD